MTKPTKDERMILAGMLAVSNMGQAIPDIDLVSRAVKHPPSNANVTAVHFAEQYMETNDHERMFASEVRGWVKNLQEMSWEEIRKAWPDIAQRYDEGFFDAKATVYDTTDLFSTAVRRLLHYGKPLGEYRNLWSGRRVRVYRHPTDQAQIITVGDTLQGAPERFICVEPYTTVAARVENNDWRDYQ